MGDFFKTRLLVVVVMTSNFSLDWSREIECVPASPRCILTEDERIVSSRSVYKRNKLIRILSKMMVSLTFHDGVDVLDIATDF